MHVTFRANNRLEWGGHNTQCIRSRYKPHEDSHYKAARIIIAMAVCFGMNGGIGRERLLPVLRVILNS